ncbi:major tail protein [Bacillus amyloliquefaciens]|uniref:major tail protein n=3 Tax=Bacillaceae TaxID=186817 RepID=UPI000AC5FD63|nr:major tail protein [Bacillus amyloliquefaciens]
MAGTRMGLRDIYFAKLIKDDEAGATYDKPVKIGKAIEASISPNTNSETLNADDGPSEIETAFGGVEVEIGVDQLSHDIQALLLGHTVNADGVLEKKDTDLAP